MAKPIKSTFTFKVVPGEKFGWEIETYFFNFKSKVLEPLSSSPQSTPRHLKVPFGFIESVELVDDNYLNVRNHAGDMVLLQYDKLSPRLDDQDSKMKRTLMHIIQKESCHKLAHTISCLLKHLHSENNLTSPSNSVEEHSSTKSSSRISSSSYSTPVKRKSTAKGDSTSSCPTPAKRSNSLMSKEKAVVALTKQFEVGFDSDSDTSSLNLLKSYGETEEHNISVEEDNVNEDLLETIQNIMSKAKFWAVKCEDIEIPASIKIDKLKVEGLKESLQKTPDKTKCFVGLVRMEDEEGNREGKYECWVNCELFVAVSEVNLECNGAERVMAVLHTASGIDRKTLGEFLHANSKDFAFKFQDKLNYQDLLRFSCQVFSEDKSEKSVKFVRNALRSFTKGNKNSAMFIKLSSLEEPFLSLLEKFISLYEEGSLHGSQLSARKLCGLDNNFKRKKVYSKLEVPIQLFKLQLKVSPGARLYLMKKMLNKEITLSEYRNQLLKTVGLVEVKMSIEVMSGLSVTALRSKHANHFDNVRLSDFIGVKNLATGPNSQLKKLTRHVKNVLAEAVDVEKVIDDEGTVSKVKSDMWNVVIIAKRVKEATVVILQCGREKELFDRFEHSIREHVTAGGCMALFIVDDGAMKDLSMDYDQENTGVIVEKIFVKNDKPEIVNGVKREIVPILLVGQKESLIDKDVLNFYPNNLKEALPVIVRSLAEVGDSLLSVFSEDLGVINVDPGLILKRRGVSICYVSTEDLLKKFSVD